tara:strand:- start:95 stop:490 length:396 start_codon:yes stop_codon:yes gene_type:complete
MKINSSPNDINISCNILFDKLCNIQNFKKIMPENTSKFEIINSNTLMFSLKGMPPIKLAYGKKISPSIINLNSTESKINFSLTAHIKKIDNNNCTFSLEFNGNLNPMIEMMIKTPLQSFINDLSKNTTKLV